MNIKHKKVAGLKKEQALLFFVFTVIYIYIPSPTSYICKTLKFLVYNDK